MSLNICGTFISSSTDSSQIRRIDRHMPLGKPPACMLSFITEQLDQSNRVQVLHHIHATRPRFFFTVRVLPSSPPRFHPGSPGVSSPRRDMPDI